MQNRAVFVPGKPPDEGSTPVRFGGVASPGVGNVSTHMASKKTGVPVEFRMLVNLRYWILSCDAVPTL